MRSEPPMFRLTLLLAESQRFEFVHVHLEYSDVPNDYHQTAVFALRRGHPPVIWEFPLRNPAHLRYRVQYSVYYPNGWNSVSSWEEQSLHQGALLVSPPVGTPRAATDSDGLGLFPRDLQRGANADLVHFSVAAPSALAPASVSELSLWAHTEAQREEVLRRISAATDAESVIKSKGPVNVSRGCRLTLTASIDGLRVEPAEDEVLWAGDIATTIFVVTVPEAASTGARSGRILIKADGFQIARVHFAVSVSASAPERVPLPSAEELHRRAFASYANADRDEVLRTIQGMQKIAPQLEIILDVLTLRSGEEWERRLWTIIPQSDVFYLFWSVHASQSQWVEKEWRCALTSRGRDFIDPVPLEDPEIAPPPPELAFKHFNDWTLAFRRHKPSSPA